MKLTGAQLIARALEKEGLDTFFFVMGAPMSLGEKACLDIGMRGIDVRHEQAAAMMAHAYARVSNKPGLCMACSGPGALNFGMSLANATVDCTPIIAFGGASQIAERGTGSFQEFDQVAAMAPLVKWAERIYQARRIPEIISIAIRKAMSGKPGPVYLDFPSDVLLDTVEEEDVVWGEGEKPYRPARAAGAPEDMKTAIDWLSQAERPVIVSGSGIFWSDATGSLRDFVETTGIPLYTTPQGRGVVPEDHEYIFPNARSAALKQADVVLVAGTRLNYVFGYGRAPRFNPEARLIRIDVDPDELAKTPQVDLSILADAKVALDVMLEAGRDRLTPDKYAGWRQQLQAIDEKKAKASEAQMSDDSVPIHPLRLCKELRDFLPRDAILAVDGQEILNYGRQAIPTYTARHRLNSGPFGTMGVGLPFGLGAKAAKPDTPVVVLHGDGSFGMNGMELDTAVRHGLPVLVVISLNGGWTADPEKEKPGRDLGYTRFHDLAKSLDCAGFYVEKPEDIRPALEQAAQEVAKGRPALVNVVTDWQARAQTVQFTRTST